MPVDFVDLNKGPVVVIDDEIGGRDDINNIIDKIEEKGLPVLKYTHLDKADKEISNICFSNFIILDWDLKRTSGEFSPEITLGESAKYSKNEKIKFIKTARSICFSPIFIFTNFSRETVEDDIPDEIKNFIFIKNKQEILKNLFEDINKWILENPHIYISKIWLNQFLKNSNEIFWLLYEKNSNWPNVFYKSLKEDGEDPISGLNDILFRLVRAKMNLNTIDDKIFEKDIEELNTDEIKLLYASILYLKENIKDDIKPGDIFKEGQKYYINIRPECDTTKRDNGSTDNTSVYLIKGIKIDDKDVQNKYYYKRTGIVNKIVSYILPFLDENNFVLFQFKDLGMRKYSEMKDKKICRLLPPFITSFQHHFSSFLGRYGTPRVPKQVSEDIFKGHKDTKEDKNSA